MHKGCTTRCMQRQGHRAGREKGGPRERKRTARGKLQTGRHVCRPPLPNHDACTQTRVCRPLPSLPPCPPNKKTLHVMQHQSSQSLFSIRTLHGAGLPNRSRCTTPDPRRWWIATPLAIHQYFEGPAGAPPATAVWEKGRTTKHPNGNEGKEGCAPRTPCRLCCAIGNAPRDASMSASAMHLALHMRSTGELHKAPRCYRVCPTAATHVH